MSLLELAKTTVGIVVSGVNQILGGALEEIGTQIVQVVQDKIKDTLMIEQAKEDPTILEATIITEANKDPDFKERLEKLLSEYQQEVQNNQATNQYASNNNININVGNNPGQVTGIDQRSFRP